MATPYKREGRWIVQWKDSAGTWRQERTKCRNKLEAGEYLRQLENQAQNERRGLQPIHKPSTMNFGELLDWYAENFGQLHRWQLMGTFVANHLRPELGQLTIPEITGPRISALLNSKRETLAPKSINHLRTGVHVIFASAIKRGLWQGANPAREVPRMKVPRRLPTWLKSEEVESMLAELSEGWRPLFATAVYTGMRRGELCALEKSDVDLDAMTIVVSKSWEADTTKGNRADVLPIHPELKPYLVDAMNQSPSKLMFSRADGSMHSPTIKLQRLLRSALGRAGIVEGWTHKCRRCGTQVDDASSTRRKCPTKCGMTMWPAAIPRLVRFHDLRHTTATLLLKAGTPLAVVSKMLRHSDVSITLSIYGHLDIDDLRAGIESLSFGAHQEHGEEAGFATAPVRRNSETDQKKAPVSVDFSKKTGAFNVSGRQDLNLRPLGPEPSALPG